MEIYEKLSNRAFRRKTGVKKQVFFLMAEVVKEGLAEKRKGHKSNAGRPRRFSVEQSVLLTLAYWREYRTYFSLAEDYDVAESTIYETIREVEDILAKDARFKLPNKRAFTKNSEKVETAAVDSTECPVERPKKNKIFTTLERKNGTPSRCNL